jgi:hypothetical protein
VELLALQMIAAAFVTYIGLFEFSRPTVFRYVHLTEVGQRGGCLISPDGGVSTVESSPDRVEISTRFAQFSFISDEQA